MRLLTNMGDGKMQVEGYKVEGLRVNVDKTSTAAVKPQHLKLEE